ncbi:multiple sugar transport system permease protein [Spinactinospora alkalitolerans]|uniref:Multiple sugar transport system permease protein n=1 Tax=Spinactinospora alkalitolerans TaxID=687207 RepID=A0A852TT81_9ACTN|nr:sugar ABC transporter permease [Spinactinospora alkalitolerans]NYE46861.1 multiple sugar transport system permease protein [Spinactinospora alkalitolerans]
MSAPTVTRGQDTAPRSRGEQVASAPLLQRLAGSPWSFLLPFLLVYGAFLLWPLLRGFWLSFTDTALNGSGGAFVGLANYAEALGDPMMWNALGNTAFFTVISTVPLVLIALAMALLVHSGLPGQWLWRLSFFLPFLLPVATVALVWKFLYNQDFGLINQFIGFFGGEGVGWLSDTGVAMWSIALTTVWWTVGFNFLLYLAALQSIPDHLYEAAAIDGAGAWARLRSITLPQLRGTTVVVCVLQLLASLKVFDQIYLMTMGGPQDSTRSLLLYVYDVGFTGYRFGYSAAVSYLFLAIVVVISIVQLRLAARRRA